MSFSHKERALALIATFSRLTVAFRPHQPTGFSRWSLSEIMTSDAWEFHAGDEKTGSISYQQSEKGKIHYADLLQKRLVQSVEWYDRAGITRFWDHYNRYGDNCARTVCDAKGQPMSKSWFSSEGREIIVENYITHDIILNDENTIKFFQTKEELILYYLKKLGFDQCNIFFNSLSTPFFLSNRLKASSKTDVLFWQEMVGEEVPWNMRLILDGRACRCDRIMVQTRKSYNRLLELGVPKDRIQKLGYIYAFEKENGYQPEALICTNSDRIEHCEELIRRLPEMHFHIAALTWMSPVLFALDRYDNVSLYPGAELPLIETLFKKCDYYFDINHWNEIVSAVYRAFLHNHLIFAFQETVHDQKFVAEDYIYLAAEFERMAEDVKKTMADKSVMKWHLEKQREHALAENKAVYAELLDV